ncbi:bifunctional adenosylcobinamide kinase/adenosylcobinamide-phosphate guanylyltransferase [Anaeroselena agilis]|uniref:Adenosylcobinamide kinase n=1 Tax=Anaeroselena agilis TaxID=3063788 RepID=A0ABU3NY70_9FIRM|nr:bifunctional adenosylcobinamide kinase/adenosylcobinamide-phosphate guanylyltransferase [Selenomonadales bacterium 4137-cl]
MSGKIVLVTGGARSGKSAFAEKYVAALGVPVAYIATAETLDAEMAARVALHRARRPASWQTYEAPRAAHQALGRAAEAAGAVLFDCLTVYVANLLLDPAAAATAEERHSQITGEIARLAAAARTVSATVVFVTNEVGAGIVPDNALAREYRDLAGLANQRLAAVADEVYLVVSGIAVDIKKLATTIPTV